jgi:hypothetical protein
MDWKTTWWLVVTILASCGPTEGGLEGGLDAGSDSSSDEDTGDDSPDGCSATTIPFGIAGSALLRTCDIEGDCVGPEAGVDVLLYEGQSPQIGGGQLDPGMIDATLEPFDRQTSGAHGRFEFALEQGDYVLCVLEPADLILCTEMIEVTASLAVWHATYEHGNGSSWSVDACVQ